MTKLDLDKNLIDLELILYLLDFVSVVLTAYQSTCLPLTSAFTFVSFWFSVHVS